MKKIISIMAAGVLLLSSVSVFADTIYYGDTRMNEKFDNMANVAATSTIPTDYVGFTGSDDNGFKFDNNTNSSATVEGFNRGTAEAPDWALKFASTEASGNDYLWAMAGYWGSTNKYFSTDFMITGDNGVRIVLGENYTTWKGQRDIIEFSTGGGIAVYGYSGKIAETWEKNKWYNITIVYETTDLTSAAPTVIELREDGAEGELICSWIGSASAISGSNAAPNMGANYIAFQTQTGPTSFVIDNMKFVRLRANDASGVTTVAYPYETFRAVSGGKVIDNIADVVGNTVTIEYSNKDSSISATTPKLIVACYDVSGRMLDVNMTDIAFADSANNRAQLDVPSTATSIKAFRWDNDSGMMPIGSELLVD